MSERVRLDQLLVARELAPSRERAQALILAGAVQVDGRRADRAAAPVAADVALTVASGPRYVSRGGEKLAGVLDDLGLDVAGKVVLDVGSSTGGFTDCLLQHGARKVYAVDVGTNQLHWKLRSDDRVISIEHCNLRHWDPTRIPERCSVLVGDLSFISLRLTILPVLPSLTEDAEAILLVKPQFEAGRGDVGEGGIVRDASVHERVCREIWDFFNQSEFVPQGLTESPIRGGEGNKEYLLHLRRGAAAGKFPEGLFYS